MHQWNYFKPAQLCELMSLCKVSFVLLRTENQTISLETFHEKILVCMKSIFSFFVKSTICARKLMGVNSYSFCFTVNAWDVIKWYLRFWKISLNLQFHENCSIDPKIWTPFFWDQNILLIIILQLYDDIMIFQYKTTTLKHNRTWTATPSPNGLGGHIKVGQKTQEGCSKVRNDLWIPILSSIFKQSWTNLFTGKCYPNFGLQRHL